MTNHIYEQLGTKPIINACGIYTDLGGSMLSPTVWDAMNEANHHFVDLRELLDTTGQVISELIGSEAARVTPGASAAIVLACAACMTGANGSAMEQLPDTTGLKQEIVIQARHRYKYDRMIRMSGARLVEAGQASVGTTENDLRTCIGQSTAGIFFPGHLDGADGTLPLAEVISIAREHLVPVLVDAAYLNYPIDLIRSFTRAGADLAIFSAKYFGGPNAGGFVCGSSHLVEAIAQIDFTGFESGEHLTLGRPFKLDRQLVVAVTIALREWVTSDHTKRFRHYGSLVRAIAQHLADIPAADLRPMSFTMAEQLESDPVNCLVIAVGSDERAAKVDAALRSGNPPIYAHLRDNAVIVDVEMLSDDQADLIGRRLREELACG